MKILLMNGPNLNMLGLREPKVYGKKTLPDINSWLLEEATVLDVQIDFFQSNCEGALIDTLHAARGVYDAVVLNPGALGHYSYALRDAIAAINVPVIEVHISNIAAREQFRRESVISAVCAGVISGLGCYGYLAALRAAKYLYSEKNDDQV